jgi:hypothetical protein
VKTAIDLLLRVFLTSFARAAGMSNVVAAPGSAPFSRKAALASPDADERETTTKTDRSCRHDESS